MHHLSLPSLARRLFMARSLALSLGGFTAFSLFPYLSTAADSEEVRQQAAKTLTALAYRLFPHESLPHAVYQQVAGAVLLGMQQSSSRYALVTGGLSRLDVHAENTTWLATDSHTQIDILQQMQTTPFFKFLQNTAIEVIYRDPSVWQLLGYGGSAIEQGGYLHRGFDDIDWLPETD
ncbi:MAG: hypothetical protein ACE5GZ_11570 [Gammaproteobacteria bacterium]